MTAVSSPIDLEIVTGRANKARLNRSPMRTPREVLGVLRAVMFAPEDLALVRGEPGERRRYLDELATTDDPGSRLCAPITTRCCDSALHCSRPRPVRGTALTRVSDTLDVWDGHLAAHGAQLIAARVELVNQLHPEVEKAYQLLAPASRPVSIRYRSNVERDRRRQNETAPSSSRRPCWTHWRGGATPRSSAACVW